MVPCGSVRATPDSRAVMVARSRRSIRTKMRSRPLPRITTRAIRAIARRRTIGRTFRCKVDASSCRRHRRIPASSPKRWDSAPVARQRRPSRAQPAPRSAVVRRANKACVVAGRWPRDQPASRNAARTAVVSGRTPRQRKNDSAACSTSIPSPCAACSMPTLRAQRTKGVSVAA